MRDVKNKCLIIVFAILLIMNASFGGNVHLLSFVSSSEDISSATDRDYDNVVEMVNLLDSRAIIEYYGEQWFSKDTLLSLLEKMALGVKKFDPNDIVFFYISSHGNRTVGTKGLFPNIEFPDGEINSKEIYDTMKKLAVRMTVTIIDACNYHTKDVEFTKYRKSSSILNPEGFPQIDIKKIGKGELSLPHISKLLKSSEGDYIIASSQPQYPAFINGGVGSIFTISFVNSVYSHLNQRISIESVDWSNIFAYSQVETVINSNMYIFLLDNEDENPYTPIWRIPDSSSNNLKKYQSISVSAVASINRPNSRIKVKKYRVEYLVKGDDAERKEIDYVIYHNNASFKKSQRQKSNTKTGNSYFTFSTKYDRPFYTIVEVAYKDKTKDVFKVTVFEPDRQPKVIHLSIDNNL